VWESNKKHSLSKSHKDIRLTAKWLFSKQTEGRRSLNFRSRVLIQELSEKRTALKKKVLCSFETSEISSPASRPNYSGNLNRKRRGNFRSHKKIFQ
jgi:hypothetical protein